MSNYVVLKNSNDENLVPITKTEAVKGLSEALVQKQDTLVSGTNIKTIGGQSVLGAGNIELPSGGSTGDGFRLRSSKNSPPDPTVSAKTQSEMAEYLGITVNQFTDLMMGRFSIISFNEMYSYPIIYTENGGDVIYGNNLVNYIIKSDNGDDWFLLKKDLSYIAEIDITSNSDESGNITYDAQIVSGTFDEINEALLESKDVIVVGRFTDTNPYSYCYFHPGEHMPGSYIVFSSTGADLLDITRCLTWYRSHDVGEDPESVSVRDATGIFSVITTGEGNAVTNIEQGTGIFKYIATATKGKKFVDTAQQSLTDAEKLQVRTNINAQGRYIGSRASVLNPLEGDVVLETVEEPINVTLPTGNESVTVQIPTGMFRGQWPNSGEIIEYSGYDYGYMTQTGDLGTTYVSHTIERPNIITLPDGITQIDLTVTPNRTPVNGFELYLVSITPYQYINGKWVNIDLDTKQETLVSGSNIKTINGVSILGSGDITIGNGGTFVQTQVDWNQSDNTAVDYIKNKPSIPAAITIDQTYSGSSTNAQSGVAIAGALAGKQDVIDVSHKLDYSLISNTPTIPASVDISGKEDVSNKVTSLSSNSTDNEYPSAKCVYDMFDGIETLLASL